MSGEYLELIKNYMRDAKLREQLNTLAKSTFGVEFEGWVQDGYFEGQYIPYSFFREGKIVANVSVNLMHFRLFGQEKRYVQLGTVMTKKEYRNRGLARRLIDYVIEDYQGKAEDIYLFGNDFTRDFYLKRGFKVGEQYQYFLEGWKAQEEREFQHADYQDLVQRKIYLEYLRTMKENSAFAMNNYGLMTFWTADMQNVYYSRQLGCYISAEIKTDTLYLNSIVSPRNIKVSEVLRHMGPGFSKVVLGFTPREDEMSLFQTQKYEEKDCIFLYLGEDLKCVEDKKLFFPVYSHA